MFVVRLKLFRKLFPSSPTFQLSKLEQLLASCRSDSVRAELSRLLRNQLVTRFALHSKCPTVLLPENADQLAENALNMLCFGRGLIEICTYLPKHIWLHISQTKQALRFPISRQWLTPAWLTTKPRSKMSASNLCDHFEIFPPGSWRQ